MFTIGASRVRPVANRSGEPPRAHLYLAAGPLIGVYNIPMPCPALNLSAQGGDGVALQCLDQAYGDLQWSHRMD